MYKLTINGQSWTGDIHDAPVNSGDVVECERPIVFERPTYLWEGVEGITFHCPNRINIITEPYKESVVYWPDGSIAETYNPAPWVADWSTPDGNGRIGHPKLLLPEVEERKRELEEVEARFDAALEMLEAEVAALDKVAENPVKGRMLQETMVETGLTKTEFNTIGALLPDEEVS